MKKQVKEEKAPNKYIELTAQNGKKALFEQSMIIRAGDIGKYRILVVRGKTCLARCRHDLSRA